MQVFLGPFFVNNSAPTLMVDSDLRSHHFFTDFLTYGTGPFSSSGISALGFVASSNSDSEDHPDIQLACYGMGVHSQFASHFARAFNLKTDVIEAYLSHAKRQTSFFQIVTNARPKAAGVVQLRSSDPHTPAQIDPKYLNNQEDMSVLIEGIKKGLELVEDTPTFKKLGAKFTEKKFPGCESWVSRSDRYWDCYLRQFAISFNNMVGTCKMGLETDTEAVVDKDLKVFGTKRLRIMDASIMPNIVVGDTSAATLMIGEKGSAMLLDEWEGSDPTSVGLNSLQNRNNCNYGQYAYSWMNNNGVKPIKLPTADEWLQNLNPNLNSNRVKRT